MENVPSVTSDSQYWRYTGVELQSSNGKWGDPSPSSHRCRDSGVDPDGEPLLMDLEDSELARKMEELQEIEERIIQKKAAIAIKTVGLLEKNQTPLGVSSDGHTNTGKAETLRNRVKEILQKRPFSIFSQVQSRKRRLKSSILKRSGLLQEHHPLKLRVKALKQKLGDPCASPTTREKVPDLSVPLTSGSKPSPAEGEISSSKDFQHFIPVLNKSADSLMEMVPDAPPCPPSQSLTSPAKEENNKGFNQFLSLLHKGGDAFSTDVEPNTRLRPASQSVTSPAEEEDASNKGFECFLRLLNKGGDRILSDKVADATLPPQSRSVSLPEKEEKRVEKGFERFLNVLNKGVDIDLLQKIVNDDGEDLLNFQSKSDPPPRRKTQQTDSRAAQPGCSRSGVEAEAEPLGPEQSLPGANKMMTKKRGSSLHSSSQSESSRVVKMLKEKIEEEDGPKVDERQEQLQNILQSLGLNLEAEEMSKLTDRTQERLYGKKNEGKHRANTRKEESPQKSSHTHSSSSSSSSSSSCASYSSSSRSRSPSPSPSRRSRSRESTEESERRSRAGPPAQRKSCNKAQRPASRNQTPPHPAAFPDYNLYQYSHYADCHSNTYMAATNSSWSYSQDDSVPASPEQQPSYPQQGCDESEVARRLMSPHLPRHCHLKYISPHTNPDLSASEGQSGSTSGPRCLKVVTTERPSERFVMELEKQRQGPKHRSRKEIKVIKEVLAKKRQESLHRGRGDRQLITVTSQVEASQGVQDHKTDQSEQEKPEPTEEEIKANLRKKLQAFNQKVKDSKQVCNLKAVRPENPLSFELS